MIQSINTPMINSNPSSSLIHYSSLIVVRCWDAGRRGRDWLVKFYRTIQSIVLFRRPLHCYLCWLGLYVVLNLLKILVDSNEYQPIKTESKRFNLAMISTDDILKIANYGLFHIKNLWPYGIILTRVGIIYNWDQFETLSYTSLNRELNFPLKVS